MNRIIWQWIFGYHQSSLDIKRLDINKDAEFWSWFEGLKDRWYKMRILNAIRLRALAIRRNGNKTTPPSIVVISELAAAMKAEQNGKVAHLC